MKVRTNSLINKAGQMVCRVLPQNECLKLAMADTQEWRHLFTYFIVGILILYSKNVLRT